MPEELNNLGGEVKVGKPVVLMVLDGWGLAPEGPGNVISSVNAPVITSLMSKYPSTQLAAAGEAVGLPAGEDGNSEVGHLNLGAGRVVPQSLPRINLSIVNGSFFENPALKVAVENVKQTRGAMHLMGLIGSGGVHAYNEHLWALLALCKKSGLEKVYLHLFTDGRDSPPTEGRVHINNIQAELNKLGIGKIVTIMGRYYAMDRDLRWERTKRAYESLTQANGNRAVDPYSAIEQSYKVGVTDEFIEPIQIGEDIEQTRIKDNDSVIFFNFRIDRPRQLTKAFVLPDFESLSWSVKEYDPGGDYYHIRHYDGEDGLRPFKRAVTLKNLSFVTMCEYEPGLPVEVAFPPITLKKDLGEVISNFGLKQLRLAESEKERFVTKYFNGGREEPYPGEVRKIIPSVSVATYDLKPEMSTAEIVEELVRAIGTAEYDFILVNIAAPDMVAHTGNMAAAIRAIREVDAGVGKTVEAILKTEGVLVITADHGNAEEMINLSSKEIDTEHSVNMVPLIVVGSGVDGKISLRAGVLGDVAPTILKLMGREIPVEMEGKSLC